MKINMESFGIALIVFGVNLIMIGLIIYKNSR